MAPTTCGVCGGDANPAKLRSCNTCDTVARHTYCLGRVNLSTWQCSRCIRLGVPLPGADAETLIAYVDDLLDGVDNLEAGDSIEGETNGGGAAKGEGGGGGEEGGGEGGGRGVKNGTEAGAEAEAEWRTREGAGVGRGEPMAVLPVTIDLDLTADKDEPEDQDVTADQDVTPDQDMTDQDATAVADAAECADKYAAAVAAVAGSLTVPASGPSLTAIPVESTIPLTAHPSIRSGSSQHGSAAAPSAGVSPAALSVSGWAAIDPRATSDAHAGIPRASPLSDQAAAGPAYSDARVAYHAQGLQFPVLGALYPQPPHLLPRSAAPSLPFHAQPFWRGSLFIATTDSGLLPLGPACAHLSLIAVSQVSLAADALAHLAATTAIPTAATTTAPTATAATAATAAAHSSAAAAAEPPPAGAPSGSPSAAPSGALILQESRRSDPGAWPAAFTHAMHSPSGITFSHAGIYILGEEGVRGGGGTGDGGDGGAGDAFAAYVDGRMQAHDMMCDVVVPELARVSIFSPHLMSPWCQSTSSSF
ncbi:hypothetical protein CLOM_g5652 [Closterium sp. NIES-68]|nr:hypothetical protein CLOM_g5652 [Closterium sp. NIES-68]GJP64006.1 hypothetical protein CLOP_g21042 [Closterium sp. NIES-67]